MPKRNSFSYEEFDRVLPENPSPKYGEAKKSVSYGNEVSEPCKNEVSDTATRVSYSVSPVDRIIGKSRSIITFKEKLIEFAQRDAPVLLLGESGTGKDLAAQCVHDLSNRRDKPFIALNCGAIPPQLIETELFGSEKGAFTDANSRPGQFELSNGGTLFLDEIGEMPLTAQVKLLRVLENKKTTRLGGQKEIPLDFRIISASNIDLRKEFAQNRFRLDLLYRINTLFLEVPPLRKRKEDILLLASFFLSNLTEGREIHFSPNAIEKLATHDWPGNIRELKNVVERAYYSCKGSIIKSSEVEFFI